MTTANRAMARIKDASPAPIKRLADAGTRFYGQRTARWRPLPDFLIVGAKRGGTTSLWNYLIEHPQVLPMFPIPRGAKSNAFFFENLARGEDWYRSHFHTRTYRRRRERRVGPTVTGEASPYYLYGPHVPGMIASMMPSVRLIALLRDPVQRAYGHYQERVKEGVEPLTFEAALDAEPARLAADAERRASDPSYYSVAHDYFSYRDRGIYLPQVRRLHEHFPTEQILILRSEDLYTDPQATFATVCRFLGVQPRELRDPRQFNRIDRAPIDPDTEAGLYDFYRPHNAELAAFLGREFHWEPRDRSSGTV